jgi:hypothetical protein
MRITLPVDDAPNPDNEMKAVARQTKGVISNPVFSRPSAKVSTKS